MSRSELRSKQRKQKGGAKVHISIHYGHQNNSLTPYLDYASKAGKRDRMEKTLRSKQVEGF